MTPSPPNTPFSPKAPFPQKAWSRFSRPLLLFGLLVLALCVVISLLTPADFLASYLVGYLLWSGVAFGALVLLAIHHLAGGGWGYLIRRILEAATRTWPIVILMFLPVIAGVSWLYPWADPAIVRESHLLQLKQSYLNVPAFAVRSAIFFAVFIGVVILLNRASSAQDEDDDSRLVRRLQNVSGPGIVIFVICLSFALIDWAMSLKPEWFSTMLSPMLIVGDVVSALAVAIIALSFVSNDEPLAGLSQTKYVLDLGNMFFAFLVLWSYMQFSQFLIIWSGNLVEEVPWYISRIEGGWLAVTVLLAIFHFALPFAILLSRKQKRSLKPLTNIAILVLAVRVLASIWIVVPSIHPEGFTFRILDWLLPIGIGGVWLAFFAGEMQRLPLLPLKDPRLQEAIHRLDHPRVGDVHYE